MPGDGTATTATYVGGTGYDYGYGIAIDGGGNALVTGYTSSTDFAGASNAFHGGSNDAFVAKVPGDGTATTATYVGGSGSDYGYGIAVNGDGNALVTGNTSSTDFAGANNVHHGGTSDAFVAEVTSAGSLARATYLGGSGADTARDIAVDASGNVLVTGYTSSTNLAGANNAYHGGAYDAFLRKLDPMFQEWPGIVVDPISGLTTTEGGGTATIRVALSTQPTADVTIGFSSSDTNEGTVSPASLTFTPGNWNVTQTVTVTGVDDAVYDGNVAYTIITAPAASGDPNYNGFDPADVSVTNKDFSLAPTITFGGPGDDKATGVAIDANGNVYVTGSFQNTVDFNPDPSAAYNLTVVGSSTSNDFVASYSPSGAFRWAHQIAGGYTPVAVAAAAGNVFVSASFSGAADFDPSHPGSHTLTSRGGNDEFLLKLDANTGNFTWVQQIGGSGNESAGGIAMGPDGNVYLAGNTTSGTDLKFGSLRPSGSGGLYITKVNASTGQFLWATRTGTNSGVVPNSIAVDSANSIYVAGDYSSSQQFGSKSITLKPHGTWDGFLLKTNSTGKPLWADGFGAAGGEAQVDSVAVDASGLVYLTGRFGPSLDSYSNTNLTGTKGILTSAGTTDAFVLKVNSSGSLVAKQRMGGPFIYGDWGTGIAVDSASGVVYVKGAFYLNGDFGSQNFTSRYGWWDLFVAKLKTADLSFVQTYHFGLSADPGGANGVAVGATGVYVAGTYSYRATFPAGDYHSCAGTADAFVLKLNPGAAMISGRVFADVNSNGKPDDGVGTPQACTVFIDANGNGTLDPGEVSTTTYGDQDYYEFYGLDAGQYNVVEVPAAGWTPTTPVSQPVTLGAGQSAVVDFGNYFPTQTSIYASTAAPVAIKSSTTTTMPITVTDSYRILDLNVTVNLTYQPLSDLTVTLIAPNGTRLTLAGLTALSGANFTGTTFDDEAAKSIGHGTAPYTGSFRPDVPLQWVEYYYNSNIQGQWLLEVYDRTTAPGGSFLNSWSMTVVHQSTQTNGVMAGTNSTASLTDAALASLVLYDFESPSKPARGKGLAMVLAVDLALAELGV